MFTILFFLFSFNAINPTAGSVDDCNCLSTAENVQKATSANEAVMAYADFQMVHLQQLSDIIDGFLSSGHTTGRNIKNYNTANNTLKQGIRELNMKKAAISKMTIKNVESYTASLIQVFDLGTDYFDRATNLIGLKKNGQKEFTSNSDIKILPECIRVGSDMKTACLNGIQRMVDCGIYTVLGLSRLLDDQAKCDGKAASAIQICSQSGGYFDSSGEAHSEMIKADMACEEHAKIVGGGSKLQTQTWDGF
ncbi:MAG: hypothetical protein WAT79_15955 [Saprospiraceae bacterium]